MLSNCFTEPSRRYGMAVWRTGGCGGIFRAMSGPAKPLMRRSVARLLLGYDGTRREGLMNGDDAHTCADRWQGCAGWQAVV